MKILYLLVLLSMSLFSSEKNILENSQIYLDYKSLSIEKILEKEFVVNENLHLNYGFAKNLRVYLKFSISNDTSRDINKILEINNPLLEHVTLYDEQLNSFESGMLGHKRDAINPHFEINLKPFTQREYILLVSNNTTTTQFAVLLRDKEIFFSDDKLKQISIFVFIGIIFAFLLYSLFLYFYTKDKAYFYYVIYIVALLFQQLTYVGILPLYASVSFTYIDNLIVVPKVSLMIITAALFARSFLKIYEYKALDKLYKIIIVFTLLQIFTISSPSFYYPIVTVITGTIFIFINLYAGIYIYKKGFKQARFFIFGWSILIFGYLLTIVDALGIYSVMYHFPQLIMMCTVFEALFLLLAFVDKLEILQNQKDQLNTRLVKELQSRNEVIEKEVSLQISSLKVLFKELNHRVKNNLQIILSIIRLQGDRMHEEKSKVAFLELENRINSISKTHEILCQNNSVNNVDMSEYLDSLCEDIQNSFQIDYIDFSLDVNATLKLKEAVYVGLIINEIIANSIKHAKNISQLNISLFQGDKTCVLKVSDDGEGMLKLTKEDTLGMSLINTLASQQLKADIIIDCEKKCSYHMEFNYDNTDS